MKTKHYVYSILAFIATAMMITIVSCKKDSDTIVAISLDAYEVSLVTGTSKELKASVAPSGLSASGIQWNSSNTAVATVDNKGNVTAIAPGEAVITASKGNVSASSKVYVTAEVVPVEGVAINKVSLEMSIGAEQQLIVGFSPENATNRQVTWSSSDEEIATVSADGIITAVAPGDAIITVTSVDGNKTAECSITVERIMVESISLNQNSLELEVSDEEQLVAVLNPADATIKDVTWSSSNEAVATVDEDGVVTAVGVGEATITATTLDGSDKTAECDIVVTARLERLIFTDIHSGITNHQLLEGGTYFIGTVATNNVPTFNMRAPAGAEIPSDTPVLTFEYKLGGHQMITDWFKVYVFHPSLGQWMIAESHTVKNLEPIRTTNNEWATYEMDLSGVLDRLEPREWNNGGNILQIRLDSWDNQPRMWEIRNMRLEK